MEAARVLLVDDEESIRTGLSLALSRRGYEVSTCAEGLPALVEIRTAYHRGQPYGTVVLDVNLPDIDGLQLLHTIKSSYPDTPVLMISGYGNDALTKAVARTPGSLYLGKPFAPQELIDAIERLAPQPEPPAVRLRERRGQQALHATAHALLRLAPGADPADVVDRLYQLDGLCYCQAVMGRWDLVALIQGLDRAAIERRLEAWRQENQGVAAVTLMHARQPMVEPDLWPVLVDRLGASAASASPKAPGQHGASSDAIVLLEVQQEHLVDAYVRACLMEDVVQCDASRDRSNLVLTMRDWTGEGDTMRVPDALRLMPGVLRARALPVVSLERKRAQHLATAEIHPDPLGVST